MRRGEGRGENEGENSLIEVIRLHYGRLEGGDLENLQVIMKFCEKLQRNCSFWFLI